MDFFKLIKSLDELIYEVLSWMLFYPITLLAALRRPLTAMLDAERELSLPDEERFRRLLGPPLFLFLTLVVIHVIELLSGDPTGTELLRRNNGLSRFIRDDSTLLVLRVVVFGLLPLTAARRLLRIRRQPLDKEHLRGLFFGQCYPCAIYALLLSGAGFALQLKLPPHIVLSIAGALLAIAVAWFLAVETRWFAIKQQQSYLRGFGNAVVVFLEWLALALVIAITLD